MAPPGGCDHRGKQATSAASCGGRRSLRLHRSMDQAVAAVKLHSLLREHRPQGACRIAEVALLHSHQVEHRDEQV